MCRGDISDYLIQSSVRRARRRPDGDKSAFEPLSFGVNGGHDTLPATGDQMIVSIEKTNGDNGGGPFNSSRISTFDGSVEARAVGTKATMSGSISDKPGGGLIFSHDNSGERVLGASGASMDDDFAYHLAMGNPMFGDPLSGRDAEGEQPPTAVSGLPDDYFKQLLNLEYSEERAF